MFNAGGDNCLKSLTNIFNDILFKDKWNGPEEWMLSSLVPIFKTKGDLFNPNFYKGIKSLEHTFKLYKKILDGHLREVTDIDKIQLEFMPGRVAADVVLVLSRLTENLRAKKRRGFSCLLTWKRLLMGARGSHSLCFDGEGCPRIFGKWDYFSL